MSGAFIDEHKRLIAGRARTIFERIEEPEVLVSSGRDDIDATEILDEWRELFPTEEAFDRRLDRAGITEEDCRRAIQRDKLATTEPVPEWVETLEEIVTVVHQQSPEAAENSVTEDGMRTMESAFPELSGTIKSYVREQLPADPVTDVLSEHALESVLDWFQRRFEERSVRILFVEFKTFIAVEDRELALADPEEFDERPTEYYDRFIDYLFSGGFADLCQEYPMFARLLVRQIRQLNEHLKEFCYRLQTDRKELTARFGDGMPLGDVVDLEPLADDTHGDGRAVMRVEFQSGRSVVYKPRSVETGAAFYRVLDRLNEHIDIPDIRTPAYLVRDEYGWMEFIRYEECPDATAIKRYYERAGALICVAYFLEFADCQVENLIVAGDQPVIVDAETVLHPYISMDRRPMKTGLGTLHDDSVLLSLLLPFGIDDISPETRQSDMMTSMAGFSVSGDEMELEEVPRPTIKASNTDVMSVENEAARIERNDNIPRVDGDEQPPREYVEEIVDGFETAYESIVRLRDEGLLFDKIALSDELASIENRIVYRATVDYMDVINSMSSRSSLHDGARFSLEIERLAVPFCDGSIPDSPPWPLYNAERRALKRLDPPRFTCQTDEKKIYLHGDPTGVSADMSGLDRCRQRIESASHEDLSAQIEFIRGCFGTIPDSSRATIDPSAHAPEYVSDEQLRREAIRLFEQIRNVAIRSGDGAYHWASIRPWNETDRLTLKPMNPSLYDGRMGIALLGAGLYRVTGDEEYRTFALDTIRPVRDALAAGWEVPAFTHHGGVMGIGAVAYGLGTIGELLNDESLYTDALQIAEFVTEDTLDNDETLDVNSGAAGTILGLLSLHDRIDDLELLSAAVDCGDHLLENRVEAESGYKVWETLDDSPPLTGFAHGASGIAYALVRLWEATDETRYHDAAIEALKYESHTYSESETNWPDNRPWSSGMYLDQWCHGRSGVGLARLGMEKYLSDDLVTRGIERAIDGISSDTIRAYDHLCCGEAGRAVFLLEADKRRGECTGKARELLGGILQRKQDVGTYRIRSETNQITEPSFFNGLSGIAYTMLQVTAPDSLPTVLLWE